MRDLNHCIFRSTIFQRADPNPLTQLTDGFLIRQLVNLESRINNHAKVLQRFEGFYQHAYAVHLL